MVVLVEVGVEGKVLGDGGRERESGREGGREGEIVLRF